MLMLICDFFVTEKPPAVSVNDFVHSLDRDGDGEIGREEATKVKAHLLFSLGAYRSREEPLVHVGLLKS